jgi:aspartyl/asparaginyl beta-hydroxylase (cupin superfamily)
MDRQQADGVARAGIESLRKGDAADARARFEEMITAGAAPPWLALARACSLLGDPAGEEQALQRQLEADKRDLAALLAMGELKAKQDDRRAAGAFFRTALNVASVRPPPAQLRPLLDRAEAFIQETRRRYEAHLEQQLSDAGLRQETASPRTRRALDLLLGRTRLYLHQPNMFYFPELPHRQFFEREEFDWVPSIEAAIPAMKEELTTLLADEGEFDPYVAGAPGRPLPNNPLLNDPSWGAYYLIRGGEPVADQAERCLLTLEALTAAPMPVIAGRSPQAHYSLLKPGTHIAPHHGMLNTRLICHVPLVIPDGCALRVGNETRSWREGELLIFDDSFEHEAWNRSDRNRIVLIFEIWRPELSQAERDELTALFEAINLFPGGDGPDS